MDDRGLRNVVPVLENVQLSFAPEDPRICMLGVLVQISVYCMVHRADRQLELHGLSCR
jgi:hypothetical protein